MTMNDSQPLYCGSSVDNFHTSYKNWHGYLSLIVCILGTIANTLNIIVLTRREMRSPTNAILTGLAVADLAVMVEYIPYTIHDYILGDRLPREQQLSYSWACFIKFHSIFTQVLHTISIWLTVTLAVWRYIAVGYPQKNRMWCGMRTTIITIATAYVVCVLVVSPSLYLITSIAEFFETLDAKGKSIRSVPLSQYVIDYENEIRQKNAMSQAVMSSTATTWNVTNRNMMMTATGAGAVGAATGTPTGTPTSVLTTAAATATGIIQVAVNAMTNANLTATPSPSPSPSSPTPTMAAAAVDAATATANASIVIDSAIIGQRNVTVYRLFHSDLALHNKSLLNATFLIYSVLIKLIPCTALTILSVRLIAALLEAKRRRKMLTCNAANGMKPLVNGKAVDRPRKNSKTLEKEKQTDRTTRMLLAVLLLFLITEFPQGIMGLLNMLLGDAFLMQCYLKLSDLMDNLALINSSINFILYCSMSRQFRSTFTLLFRPKFLDKWLPVAQTDDGASGQNGRQIRADMISRSMAAGQQGLTTQVTNV